MGKHRHDDRGRHEPPHDKADARSRSAQERDRDTPHAPHEHGGRAPGSSYGAQGSYARGNYGQGGPRPPASGPRDDDASWQGGAQDHWRQGEQAPGGPGHGGYGELSYGQGAQRRGQGEGAYERGPEGFGQWQGGSRGGYGQPGLEPGSYGAGSYSQGDQIEGARGQRSQGVDEAQWRQTQFTPGGREAMAGARDPGREAVSRPGAHHDPHYLKWREEQIRKLDADYEAWSRERYSRFAEEFDTWRREREAAKSAAGPAPAEGAAAGDDAGGTGGTGAPPKRRRT